MRTIPVILAMALLFACRTSSYTESTPTVRATGPTVARVIDKPLHGALVELRTAPETDGFYFHRNVLADEEGRVTVSLLPAALQCLVYGHEIVLTATVAGEELEVFRTAIDSERARRVIEESRVQARLGARPQLRRAEIALLDRATALLREAAVVEALEEITPSVEVLPDWK